MTLGASRERSRILSHGTAGGCRLLHVDMEVRSATGSWRTDVQHHKTLLELQKLVLGRLAPGPVQPHHAEAQL